MLGTAAQTPNCSLASWREPYPSTATGPWRHRAAYWLSTVFDDRYSIFAGTHKIQRVSKTEKQGRRHSSTVSVIAISGERSESSISQNDVRIDYYRDRGPGGQHKNKTESAVRLTHIPTGIVVTATEDRSQQKNRKVAWTRLETAYDKVVRERDHIAENEQRLATIVEQNSWIWTDWRDSVTTPMGKHKMSVMLSGRLDRLFK